MAEPQSPLPERKELCLNETYLHFNGLIWQVPAWGHGIAIGAVVAAYSLQGPAGDDKWGIAPNNVRAIVLLMGALILVALTWALARYRHFQAAAAPFSLPTPPFRIGWWLFRANRLLQLMMCLTTSLITAMAVCEFGLSHRICVFIVAILAALLRL